MKAGKPVQKPIYNHVTGLLDPPEEIKAPKARRPRARRAAPPPPARSSRLRAATCVLLWLLPWCAEPARHSPS